MNKFFTFCKRTFVIISTIVIILLLWMTKHIFFPSPYPKDFTGVHIPEFTVVPFDFTHEYDEKNMLPLLGSVIFDADNDGKKEVFVGGGRTQPDGFFTYINEEKGFEKIPSNFLKKPKNTATYGMAVVDTNNDGLTDVFISRTDGVYLYINKGNKIFEGQKLNITFDPKAVPVSLALADLNQDGAIDMFVSTYLQKFAHEGYTIFNDDTYGVHDMLLINDGNNNFINKTKESGLEYIHNTFTAVWSDIDFDQDLDLVVAHDTGQVRTYKNNGDLTFTQFNNPNSDSYSYPMGLAIGDVNNDTYPDFFFSNTGKTIPDFLARGDLRDDQVFDPRLLLFENNKQGNFNDVSDEKMVANYEFSWGAAMADLNLDGREDIVVTESYIDFPLHNIFKLPGRLLLQKPDGKFVSAEAEAGVVNRAYGITPLIGDFENDGDEDLLHINLNGSVLACINNANQQHNWFKVVFSESVQNLNARVQLTREDGIVLTQYVTSGEGLASDQSHELVFGLEKTKTVPQIDIFYLNGEQETKTNLSANTTLVINK